MKKRHFCKSCQSSAVLSWRDGRCACRKTKIHEKFDLLNEFGPEEASVENNQENHENKN